MCLSGEIVFLVYSCHDIRTVNTDPNIIPHICANAINTVLSSMFLALAVLLNINKWIYFTLRI